MNVSNNNSSLQSVKQSIGIANLRRAMNQDTQGVALIMESMQETSAKTLEMSVTPHTGGNIDITV